MGRRRKRTFFDDSARLNNLTYNYYLDRLTELSLSMFEWKNVPDTIDIRFMELKLFIDGQVVFFQDEILGYLALQMAIGGPLNVYNIPVRRRAYASNGYQKKLDSSNSIIIWNNYMHSNSYHDIVLFARKLANLDRTIDVNVNAQKTPVLVQGSEQQRLTLLNVYKEFDGNSPVIFGDKNLDINGLKSLDTKAPYVGDKLYQLKVNVWNEALTYLGISNISIQKKERLISDEVDRNQGGTVASRYSRLESRREACKAINTMFGLNIWCDYREDGTQLDTSLPDIPTESEGIYNE